jgi:hypothetical protein
MHRIASLGTASAALAVAGVLVAACGGQTSSSAPSVVASSCDKAVGSHHAWVVVEHGNKASVKRCVGFDTADITALDITKRAGIGVSTQSFSFGVAVCEVDNEPAHYTKCLPSGAPYWALFVAPHRGNWTAASVGATAQKVHDGDAVGWRYDPASEAQPAPPDTKP